MHKRKLIEVALPLEAINRESAREKSIRHGHPSTLHLWWARRPLAATRAVLFAQLVDDPSSLPEEFPTEDLQRQERERLHRLIERLVVWENVRDEKLLAEAHAEILRSTDGNPPSILDPFAGGGSIPLEALRLGLKSRASDLNPVAVLLNKALIEIPSKFRGLPPVYPGEADTQIRNWSGAEGLAADVHAYGEWMRKEAGRRIGHLYPHSLDGTVIAWIWARTVTCPNPACGAEVPLVSTLDLSTRKGQEVWLRPVVSAGRVDFEVETGERRAEPNKRGQGAKFECWVCASAVSPAQVHQQLDVKNKPANRLLAVVSAGKRRRIYTKPTAADTAAVAESAHLAEEVRSEVTLNAECRGTFGGNAQGKRYGFFTFADYFTDRQIVALATFSDLIEKARAQVVADGGTAEYADAVGTYLALVQSKMTNLSSSVTTWMSDRGAFRETFARQAVPMAWDFAEANVLSDSGGGWTTFLGKESKVIAASPTGTGAAEQADAARVDFEGALLSTDPPYYDNIVYSDLSDYFYVWLRRSLRSVYPTLFSTLLVPKAEELVANPYRLGSKAKAKEFFEKGFRQVFSSARAVARQDLPITVYYAFKQSEVDADGTASTGWETLLEGMVQSGWEITSTWPLRTEGSGRLIAKGTNALASSIVLSLRPRDLVATITDRRGFIAALEAELPGALRKLQQGQVAPVDLPQAAIGPGMAVFSRYGAVLEPDGKRMTVRSALSRINEILDQVLNEQEGDFDATSRFAIAWYRQHGYSIGKYGDAELLANARGAVVQSLDRDGVLVSRAGNVNLFKPGDLTWDYDPAADLHTSNWEALHHLIKVLERDGIAPAGDFLRAALSRPDGAVDADLVKELAHLLFRVAEGRDWTKDALSFNNLVTSWPEIMDVAHTEKKLSTTPQGALDFEDDE